MPIPQPQPETQPAESAALEMLLSDIRDALSMGVDRERVAEVLHDLLCRDDHDDPDDETPWEPLPGGDNRYQRHADALIGLATEPPAPVSPQPGETVTINRPGIYEVKFGTISWLRENLKNDAPVTPQVTSDQDGQAIWARKVLGMAADEPNAATGFDTAEAFRRLTAHVSESGSRPSVEGEGDTITIPRPHVPYGPDHVPERVADADYLRGAVRNINHLSRGERLWGSNLTATIVKLLTDVADALVAPVVSVEGEREATSEDLIADLVEWRSRAAGATGPNLAALDHIIERARGSITRKETKVSSPFKECASDGVYTCSFCMLNGTVNCPDTPMYAERQTQHEQAQVSTTGREQ